MINNIMTFKKLSTIISESVAPASNPIKTSSIKPRIKNDSGNLFDDLYAKIISEKTWDDDDFKLDTMEILEGASKKCTGPTKKTSSTRKTKKWTKCARQPDGSYKRIHWGQKGVKVTGKSGNTKRKKSFRARHKCSSAKQGSAQQAACGDW